MGQATSQNQLKPRVVRVTLEACDNPGGPVPVS